MDLNSYLKVKARIGNIIQHFIFILLLALAFTNVYAFEIMGLQFSFYIVFGALFVVLISIIKLKTPPFYKNIAFFIFIYIITSSLINYTSFKITSIIYSFLFVVYYIYISYYFKENLNLEKYLKALKIVLWSFFIILICAQISVFFDLQQIEKTGAYFQGVGELGVEYNFRTNTYRYFSLSSEPSYAAIIVLISFALLIKHITNKRELYLYTTIVLYMILSFKSSIGFLGLFFLFFSFIKISKKYFPIIIFVILIILILFFFTEIGGKGVNRIRNIVFLFFTEFNNFFEALNIKDSSAYARIGPFAEYIKDTDFLGYKFYIGHGSNASEAYFSKIVYPEVWNKDMVFRPPFIPGFLYDYGIFGVLLVGLFFWRLVRNKSFFYKAMILLVIFNSNFNTQLFWFLIVMITMDNYFRPQKMISIKLTV